MNKYIVMISTVLVLLGTNLMASRASAADDSIKLTVESLSNVSGNGTLEACGTAIHIDGIKPILVTIKHDQSFYTVLTAPNGKWCVVFKRWTYNGQIDASATTLQNPGLMDFRGVNISNLHIK